ncbi:hypothetical protein HDU86_003585 [Geranomyces michiganensis]|nr:hypothetical protein HDU86_003585 [Geranomyces michiganensis]
MSTYQPTQHGGLKQDGTPDKRVAHHDGDNSSSNTSNNSNSHNSSSSGGGPARNPDGTFASKDSSEYNQAHSNSNSSTHNSSNSSSGAKHAQHNTGEEIYKPTEHGGLKKDGTRDHRVKDANVTEEEQE